jgi:hypothetical protein
VICYNGTLLGFFIDPIINAMPNKHPQISGALLGLPKAPKALLLQHIVVGKLNMVATKRLPQTFSFVPMTSSVV